MKKLFTEWKITGLILFLVLIGSFLLRLYNLTSFPIFADEAIYIRWAQVMRAEPTLRFLPLSDGKQPLFMWVVIPFLKLFSDPLFAGRIVSALSGVGIILGVFVFSYLLFKSKKTAILASILTSVSPFSVFFDRMALVDSMLAMLGIWFFIFCTLTAKYRRLDIALVNGFILGGALLTKSPALFFVLMAPFFVIFVDFKKHKLKNILVFLGLLLITIAIGYGFYNILRLGPNFHLINSRTQDYVYPISHLWTSPHDPFLPYIDRIIRWISVLGPLTILVLSFISTANLNKNNWRGILILIFIIIFPVSVAAMFTKAITARYVYYAIVPIFVLASGAIENNKRKIITWGVISAHLVYSLIFYFQLVKNPHNAHLPPGERAGYLVEWSSGIGIKEVAEKLITIRNANPGQQIIVGTEGYFGTLPDGLQIYLEKESNITVVGIGQNISEIPTSLVESKQAGNLTYLVANSSRLLLEPDEFNEAGLEVLYSVKKPERKDDTHEYSYHGPYDTFYLFEIVR